MLYYEAVQIFYRDCVGRMLSERTIENYSDYITGFGNYLQRVNKSNIEDVTRDDVLDYFAFKRKTCSETTIKHNFIAIRACFKCLVARHIIPINPLDDIPKPRVPKKVIQSFNREEVQAILNAFDKNTFTGFRNYAVMSILFSTGLRKSELLQMNVSDVYLDIDTMKVNGKGNKERYVPISPVLHRVIVTYLKKRKEYLKECKLPDRDVFIVSCRGGRLTKGGLGTVFAKLKQSKKQWAHRVSAHTWRHTFAKFFLLNGGDIFSLQKILGHEDIESTRIYIELTKEEIRLQNDKYNPLDNTKWQYY